MRSRPTTATSTPPAPTPRGVSAAPVATAGWATESNVQVRSHTHTPAALHSKVMEWKKTQKYTERLMIFHGFKTLRIRRIRVPTAIENQVKTQN